MSYDVGISYIGEVFDDLGNYTSNCGGMFRHKTGKSLGDFNGKTAQELADTLFIVLRDMKDHPQTYEAMNPENGWGNFETFKKYLEKIHRACINHPESIVKVSA